jgi:hypothetical protein
MPSAPGIIAAARRYAPARRPPRPRAALEPDGGDLQLFSGGDGNGGANIHVRFLSFRGFDLRFPASGPQDSRLPDNICSGNQART